MVGICTEAVGLKRMNLMNGVYACIDTGRNTTRQEKERRVGKLIIETSLLKPRNQITWQRKGNNDVESREIVTEDDRCEGIEKRMSSHKMERGP
jgi:hypothetical protein